MKFFANSKDCPVTLMKFAIDLMMFPTILITMFKTLRNISPEFHDTYRHSNETPRDFHAHFRSGRNHSEESRRNHLGGGRNHRGCGRNHRKCGPTIMEVGGSILVVAASTLQVSTIIRDGRIENEVDILEVTACPL